MLACTCVLTIIFYARRISGRLAARVVAEGKDAKRKLDYGGELRKTPKVNGSILKHKRTVS